MPTPHRTPTALVAANQECKRAQIVAAARAVLAADGVAGATARTIADASPLTKSAIHYYFDDVDQIVDLAMAAHLDAVLVRMRELAAGRSEPRERAHAVVGAYLDTFAERPQAAFLWFEYWVAAGRRGATGPAARMLADVEELVSGLVAALPGERPPSRAHAVTSWLLGTVVQEQVRPRPRAELLTELDHLLG